MSLLTPVALLAGVALGAVLVLALPVLRRRASRLPAADTPHSSSAPAREVAQPAFDATDEILRLASTIEDIYRHSSHPRDLLQNESFRRGVALFGRPVYDDEMLLDYMVGANVIVACMALEALAGRKGDGTTESEKRLAQTVLGALTRVHGWTSYFALRVLAKRVGEPMVGPVLSRVDEDWLTPLSLAVLREFIALRVARGEVPTFVGELESLRDDRLATLATLIDQLEDAVPDALRDEFRTWQDSRVNTELLSGIGRVWPTVLHDPKVMLTSSAMDEVVAQLEIALRGNPPRSVALVGEPGVGKTTLLRALAARLQQDGWTVFEAGAAELLAGQSYIGQLEGRVQSLVRAVQHRKILWVVPELQKLLWAGRHRENPTGALDLILPHLESGAICLAGELTASAYERLLQVKPQLRATLMTARIKPASDVATMELARRWTAARRSEGAPPMMEDQTLNEAHQLAKQFLGDRAAPGNLLHLLDLTHRRIATATGGSPARITLDDLLLTLSQLTGLPLSILDDRQGLDLEGLRAIFRERVIGQPEAVDCLVQRVAMIKAGVNDPNRPIGVFLFVGPTGTGKTEIAKTLARWLFGSADRMIRLDMSELQTPESLERLVGDGSGEEGTALVNAIRRQPFSVVLLDEFEKAHPNAWDLFLQVFDDGRLSDRRGNVADFRHAVIILTSNLGARLPYGATIGFVPGENHFTSVTVERAVAETFRREFINRIDRVVVFQPLGRAEMREILRKELDDVLQRRGFRNRSWAVEWDASAIDFLLERGFTPDLGARPLRRAVERYVLAPLAMTIVNREVPDGDQFLFARSDGDRLDVVFIDPDASDEQIEGSAAPPDKEPATLEVRGLVLDASGVAEEVDFLEESYQELAARVEGPEWQRQKERTLGELRSEGFWQRTERFATLGLAEFMDRVEVGLETAGSLLRRLRGSARGGRRHYSRQLVQRVAQQLYLLDAACTTLATEGPRDAYLLVRASRDTGADRVRADAFAERLGRMYREWARRRRMRLDVLEETPADDLAPYGSLFAVSGFGSYSILAPESGLHVLETPQDGKSFSRTKARVLVVPQSDVPVKGLHAARAEAHRLLEATADSTSQVIVRRYREEPSPLVRDGVRGWRTGRIDRVFGGDFDVVI